MRPSYIVQPTSYGMPQQAYHSGAAAHPPLSPSSRWAGGAIPGNGGGIPAMSTTQQASARFPFPAQSNASPSADRRPSGTHMSASVSNDSSYGGRPRSPNAGRGRASPLPGSMPSPPSNADLQTSYAASPMSNAALRPRPAHLHSSPSRLHGPGDGYQPFSLENEEVRRTGGAKGSAFMVCCMHDKAQGSYVC